MSVRISKQEAQAYSIVVDSLEHATIVLNEISGLVAVESTLFSGAHYWSSIGDQNLKEFLVGLNCQYVMEKLGVKATEWNEDKTIEGLTDEVKSMMREGLITNVQATNWLNAIPTEDHQTKEFFYYELAASIWGDVDDLHHFMVMEWPETAHRFWNEIWLPFIEHLEAELKEAA